MELTTRVVNDSTKLVELRGHPTAKVTRSVRRNKEVYTVSFLDYPVTQYNCSTIEEVNTLIRERLQSEVGELWN